MTLFIILNIVSFLRLVLIMVIVWYVIKFFMRFMAPRIVDKAANKLFQDLKDREAEQSRKTTRRGDVTIDYTNRKEKRYRRNEGEYIEFEEIKNRKK